MGMLLLKLGLALTYSNIGPGDSADYLIRAISIRETGSLNINFADRFLPGMLLPIPRPSVLTQPLFPLLIAGLSVLFGYELAGRLVPILAGALLPLVVFRLSKKFAGEKVSFTAAVLSAFVPFLFSYSTFILTDIPFVFMIALSYCLFLDYLERKTMRNALLFGAALGFSYLLRSSAIFMMAAIGAHILLRQKKLLRKNLPHLAAALVIMLLIVSPWLYRSSIANMEVFGTASNPEPGMTLRMAGMARGYSQPEAGSLLSLSKIYTSAGRAANYFFWMLPVYILTPFLAALSIYYFLRCKFDARLQPVFFYFLLLLAFHSLWPWTAPRFFFPIVPFFCIFSAIALHKIFGGNWKLPLVFICAVMISAGASHALIVDTEIDPGYGEFAECVLYQTGDGAVIISSEPGLLHYLTRRRTVIAPNMEIGGAVDFLSGYGPTHIHLDGETVPPSLSEFYSTQIPLCMSGKQKLFALP